MKMTYVYAYRRVNEKKWYITETEVEDMTEREFLWYLFDPYSGFGIIDKVRILEIIY